MARQGPAPQPATIAAVVDADHLKHQLRLALIAPCGADRYGSGVEALDCQVIDGLRFKKDAGALLEVHGG